MKKLFGHSKPKATKVSPLPVMALEEHARTPIYQQHATFNPQTPPALHPAPQPVRNISSHDRWDSATKSEDSSPSNSPNSIHNPHHQPHLPPPPNLAPSRQGSHSSLPGAPPTSSSLDIRSPSPFSALNDIPPPLPAKTPQNLPRDRTPQQLKKPRPPASSHAATLGILKSLDPNITRLDHSHPHSQPISISHSGDTTAQSDISHREQIHNKEQDKRDRKHFWIRDRDKDKEKEKPSELDRIRERDRREEDPEIIKVIGWLIANNLHDWNAIHDLCARVSASDANAKEAARALRREFKHGEPPTQRAAAKLWGIMLHNAHAGFALQCTHKRFIETVYDLVTNPRTVIYVKKSLLTVIAAAAYASSPSNGNKDGYRALWKKVKQPEQPEEGIPFQKEDVAFPTQIRTSYYDVDPYAYSAVPPTPPGNGKRRSPTRNRIIPRDEDIRRLLQECKIGMGNAALLSQALAMTQPENLKHEQLVKEFYPKCRHSQALICAQIPWATAGAESSRAQRGQQLHAHISQRTQSRSSFGDPNGIETTDGPTLEEELLDRLLATNAELVAVLAQYEDLERVATERLAEELSRKETKMDRKQLQMMENGIENSGGSGATRSPSPNPCPPNSMAYSYTPPPSTNQVSFHGHSNQEHTQGLAPPRHAPIGPRSPAHHSSHRRTPSPATPILDNAQLDPFYGSNLYLGSHQHPLDNRSATPEEMDHETEVRTPTRPSEKALGKRRFLEPEEPIFQDGSGDSLFAQSTEGFQQSHDVNGNHNDVLYDSDSDSESPGPFQSRVEYVYDAAAERAKQRLLEAQQRPPAQQQMGMKLVNGVH